MKNVTLLLKLAGFSLLTTVFLFFSPAVTVVESSYRCTYCGSKCTCGPSCDCPKPHSHSKPKIVSPPKEPIPKTKKIPKQKVESAPLIMVKPSVDTDEKAETADHVDSDVPHPPSMPPVSDYKNKEYEEQKRKQWEEHQKKLKDIRQKSRERLDKKLKRDDLGKEYGEMDREKRNLDDSALKSQIGRLGKAIDTFEKGKHGPQGGESMGDWKKRLAANIWQSIYDRVLLERAQERANRQRMGMKETRSSERIAQEDQLWAKYYADQYAKSATDGALSDWLKKAPEQELMRYNLHRDGTPRVAYGVPKRGSGMGPTLDYSKVDVHEAKQKKQQQDAYAKWKERAKQKRDEYEKRTGKEHVLNRQEREKKERAERKAQEEADRKAKKEAEKKTKEQKEIERRERNFTDEQKERAARARERLEELKNKKRPLTQEERFERERLEYEARTGKESYKTRKEREKRERAERKAQKESDRIAKRDAEKREKERKTIERRERNFTDEQKERAARARERLEELKNKKGPLNQDERLERERLEYEARTGKESYKTRSEREKRERAERKAQKESDRVAKQNAEKREKERKTIERRERNFTDEQKERAAKARERLEELKNKKGPLNQDERFERERLEYEAKTGKESYKTRSEREKTERAERKASAKAQRIAKAEAERQAKEQKQIERRERTFTDAQKERAAAARERLEELKEKDRPLNQEERLEKERLEYEAKTGKESYKTRTEREKVERVQRKVAEKEARIAKVEQEKAAKEKIMADANQKLENLEKLDRPLTEEEKAEKKAAAYEAKTGRLSKRTKDKIKAQQEAQRQAQAEKTAPDQSGKKESPPRDPSKPAMELASASGTDPKTGITTTSRSYDDGSRKITKTDKEGNVISERVVPPKDQRVASASSLDTKTGVRTTSTKNKDGTRTVTKTGKDGKVISKETITPLAKGGAQIAWTDDQGNRKMIETDGRGSRKDTVVRQDGTVRSEANLADGTKIISTTDKYDNTQRVTTRKDAQGNDIRLVENSNGSVAFEKKDRNGKTLLKVDKEKDGSQTIIDEKGRKTEISAKYKDGSYDIVKTDQRGNKTTFTVDKDKRVISMEEERKVAKEPGEDHYQKTAKSEKHWEDLSDHEKARYARAEKQKIAERQRRIDQAKLKAAEERLAGVEDPKVSSSLLNRKKDQYNTDDISSLRDDSKAARENASALAAKARNAAKEVNTLSEQTLKAREEAADARKTADTFGNHKKEQAKAYKQLARDSAQRAKDLEVRAEKLRKEADAYRNSDSPKDKEYVAWLEKQAVEAEADAKREMAWSDGYTKKERALLEESSQLNVKAQGLEDKADKLLAETREKYTQAQNFGKQARQAATDRNFLENELTKAQGQNYDKIIKDPPSGTFWKDMSSEKRVQWMRDNVPNWDRMSVDEKTSVLQEIDLAQSNKQRLDARAEYDAYVKDKNITKEGLEARAERIKWLKEDLKDAQDKLFLSEQDSQHIKNLKGKIRIEEAKRTNDLKEYNRLREAAEQRDTAYKRELWMTEKSRKREAKEKLDSAQERLLKSTKDMAAYNQSYKEKIAALDQKIQQAQGVDAEILRKEKAHLQASNQKTQKNFNAYKGSLEKVIESRQKELSRETSREQEIKSRVATLANAKAELSLARQAAETRESAINGRISEFERKARNASGDDKEKYELAVSRLKAAKKEMGKQDSTNISALEKIVASKKQEIAYQSLYHDNLSEIRSEDHLDKLADEHLKNSSTFSERSDRQATMVNQVVNSINVEKEKFDLAQSVLSAYDATETGVATAAGTVAGLGKGVGKALYGVGKLLWEPIDAVGEDVELIQEILTGSRTNFFGNDNQEFVQQVIDDPGKAGMGVVLGLGKQVYGVTQNFDKLQDAFAAKDAGTAFDASFGISEFVGETFIDPLKGVGKLGKLAKVGKVLGKSDDALRAAERALDATRAWDDVKLPKPVKRAMAAEVDYAKALGRSQTTQAQKAAARANWLEKTTDLKQAVQNEQLGKTAQTIQARKAAEKAVSQARKELETITQKNAAALRETAAARQASYTATQKLDDLKLPKDPKLSQQVQRAVDDLKTLNKLDDTVRPEVFKAQVARKSAQKAASDYSKAVEKARAAQIQKTKATADWQQKAALAREAKKTERLNKTATTTRARKAAEKAAADAQKAAYKANETSFFADKTTQSLRSQAIAANQSASTAAKALDKFKSTKADTGIKPPAAAPDTITAGRAPPSIKKQPTQKKPSEMTPAERQAYNDARAADALAAARGKKLPDPGDSVVMPPKQGTYQPNLEKGTYSQTLTASDIDALFRPGAQLTPKQIIQKADLIRTGKAPQGMAMTREAAAALDAAMRKNFPDLNLRTGQAAKADSSAGTLVDGPKAGDTFGGKTVIDGAQNSAKLPPSRKPGSAGPGDTQILNKADLPSATPRGPGDTQILSKSELPPGKSPGPGDTQILDAPDLPPPNPPRGPGDTQVLNIPDTLPSHGHRLMTVDELSDFAKNPRVRTKAKPGRYNEPPDVSLVKKEPDYYPGTWEQFEKRRDWRRIPEEKKAQFDADVRKAIDEMAAMGNADAKRLQKALNNDPKSSKASPDDEYYDYSYDPALRDDTDGFALDDKGIIKPQMDDVGRLLPDETAQVLIHEYKHSQKGGVKYAAEQATPDKPFVGAKRTGGYNDIRAHMTEMKALRDLKTARDLNGGPPVDHLIEKLERRFVDMMPEPGSRSFAKKLMGDNKKALTPDDVDQLAREWHSTTRGEKSVDQLKSEIESSLGSARDVTPETMGKLNTIADRVKGVDTYRRGKQIRSNIQDDLVEGPYGDLIFRNSEMTPKQQIGLAAQWLSTYRGGSINHIQAKLNATLSNGKFTDKTWDLIDTLQKEGGTVVPSWASVQRPPVKTAVPGPPQPLPDIGKKQGPWIDYRGKAPPSQKVPDGGTSPIVKSDAKKSAPAQQNDIARTMDTLDREFGVTPRPPPEPRRGAVPLEGPVKGHKLNTDPWSSPMDDINAYPLEGGSTAKSDSFPPSSDIPDTAPPSLSKKSGSSPNSPRAPPSGRKGPVREVTVTELHDGRILIERHLDDRQIILEKDHYLGEGTSSNAYKNPADIRPDQVQHRVVKLTTRNEGLVEDFGRSAIAQSDKGDNILMPRMDETHVYEISPDSNVVTSRRNGVPDKDFSQGGTVKFYEQTPEPFDSNSSLPRLPDGSMTAGQAIAFNRAMKALNDKGFAWLDNKGDNYTFVAKKGTAPGADEWVLMIIDPGGIVPMDNSAGRAAEYARALQKAVDDPVSLNPDIPDQYTGRMGAHGHRLEIADRFDRLVDWKALNNATGKQYQTLSVDRVPGDLDIPQRKGMYLDYNPENSVKNPIISKLAGAKDLSAAEAALRAQTPPPVIPN